MESDVKFAFPKDFSQGKLIVKARFKKRTNLNPSSKFVDFLLFFSEYFPEIPPKVLCTSNVNSIDINYNLIIKS